MRSPQKPLRAPPRAHYADHKADLLKMAAAVVKKVENEIEKLTKEEKTKEVTQLKKEEEALNKLGG